MNKSNKFSPEFRAEAAVALRTHTSSFFGSGLPEITAQRLCKRLQDRSIRSTQGNATAFTTSRRTVRCRQLVFTVPF